MLTTKLVNYTTWIQEVKLNLSTWLLCWNVHLGYSAGEWWYPYES